MSTLKRLEDLRGVGCSERPEIVPGVDADDPYPFKNPLPMAALPLFKAAAAHVAPVFLNPVRTAAKASSIIVEAARNGASLVAFPESFLPGYPVWASLHAPIQTHALFRRFVLASVFADGPEVKRIRRVAAEVGVYVSIGISERNPASVGALWNSNLLIGAQGEILLHHRKLVPTFFEKLVWDSGDGAGLRISDTPLGRIGMLICGENTNPLARFTLMAQGEQVHISSYPPAWPTRPPAAGGNYDNRTANQLRSAAHCFEGKCFGIVVAGRFDEAAYSEIAAGNKVAQAVLEQTSMATSFFLDPTGAVMGEQQVDEGIAYADIDLSLCLEPKRFHDVVAGYNRFDIFDLAVNRRRQVPIHFTQDGLHPTPAPENDTAPRPPR